MKKSGYRLTPWENNNSLSRQIRGPGSQVSSLAQRPGPLAVVGEYEDDKSTGHAASQSLSQSPRPRLCLSCWVAPDGFCLPLICLAAFWSHLNLWCLQPPVAISSSVIMRCVKRRTWCYCFSEAYFVILKFLRNYGRIKVEILSLFHLGLSSLRGRSPVPLEVGWRLLMGWQGSTKPAATAHSSHPHPVRAKNQKWVEPAETPTQQYLDHVAVNGKVQADVCPVLPAAAFSQIQIPNAAGGVGLRSVKSWSPPSPPLLDVSASGGTRASSSLRSRRSCHDTSAFRLRYSWAPVYENRR